MQLLAATGQRAAALAQYDLCRTVLADELEVAPEAATTAFYEQIRRGDDDKLPQWQDPLRESSRHPLILSSSPSVTAAPPHNLPSSLTPFLGRETEIEQIGALLADPSYRLITLVGEGGSGKTRLALAVGQKIVDCRLTIDDSVVETTATRHSPLATRPFPDGVWFIALSAVTPTGNLVDQLAVAVAQAIGLSFGGTQPLFTQLLAYVRNKALLLLFDNAEHLLPEVADVVVQLLQASPSLTALVTSRHLLGLQAEFVWRVTGLTVPPHADLPPTALLTYSSIALFAERASRPNRSFQITMENRAVIVAICRLVEGLPLAVELAATLTKQYSCAALYAALQRGYTVLATTLRDLPSRHRSIKAMLDYSWRLLTPPEAEILTACAVFPGSFDLAAAVAVTGAQRSSLTMLVDQSLLHEVQETTGNRRYALHPLVRQYAAEQLQSQPEVANRVHTEHCAYYVALLVRQSEALVRDPEALQNIQIELHNLRAAWGWAIAQSHFELLQQSSKPLAQFYKMTGIYEEAEATFRKAADRCAIQSAQTAPLPTDQARLLAALQVEQAHFCARLAQVDRAEALAQAALQVGEALKDGRIQAQSYLCLAQSRTQRADYAGARAAAEVAAGVAHCVALPDLEAWAIQTIGITYLADGDPSQGLRQLDQALTIAQALGDRYLEALIRGSLGSGYYVAGNFAYAHRYLQQAWQMGQAMKLPRLGIVALSWLSSLYIQVGLYDLAANEAQEAQKAAGQLGRHPVMIEACALFALAKYRQGDLASASHHCQFAIQLGEAHNLERYTALARLLQGHLLYAQGQWQAAAAAYTQARQAYVNRTQPPWNLRAQAGLAQCRFDAGDLAQALVQVEELLPILDARGQGGGMNVYETILICYEILTAAADSRADALLDHGYRLLQEQAAHFDDDTLRHAFLTQVAANRKLIALWSARHDQQKIDHKL